MANLRELAAQIESDRAAVEAMSGLINSSKEQAEQTAGAIGDLGFERSAARARQVVEKIEEAESIRATLQGSLVKAHFQVMSAVHGRIGPGAPGSGAIVPLTRMDADTGAPKAGLDAVPPHVRQEPTPTGEELTGVDPSLTPFQKEHEGANDDQGMSKFRRGARNMARNVGDLKDAADQLAKPTMTEMGTRWEPPETYPVVGTPEPAPVFTAPVSAPADHQNAVGNLVVVAVLVAEVAARRIKGRKGKR
ncbi:hypothetical protein [Glycomyces sp. NRRL B-16210]|uniref:hypothetical protein n=1 Tax=Glycomyces sp. NRRL B-16210 TaxID=1463821 RepID=UPI0004C0CA1E|nr:hypothetical protein [Glycomyces sp. NRRL B-16210]